MTMTNTVVSTITLSGEQINGDRICCTGDQLATVLKGLKPLLKDEQWFITDIAANHVFTLARTPTESNVVNIGGIEDLIHFALQIDQFLSGIFLAVPSHLHPNWNRSFDTEGEPTNDLGDAILEIRAFDTSYFELHTSTPQLLDVLHASFEATEATVA